MKAVICLAGGIASGKTTVAQALAEVWPNTSVRSFGDVVRQRAKRDELPADRTVLQEIGLRLIEAGWPQFVDALLADVPPEANMLIVDGVRHVEAVEELRRRFANVPVRLVFLAADTATVRQRLAERNESSDALDHHVESSLKEVAGVADLEIATSLAPDAIAAEINSSGAGPARRGIDEHQRLAGRRGIASRSTASARRIVSPGDTRLTAISAPKMSTKGRPNVSHGCM